LKNFKDDRPAHLVRLAPLPKSTSHHTPNLPLKKSLSLRPRAKERNFTRICGEVSSLNLRVRRIPRLEK
jgi:hypothetical protein